MDRVNIAQTIADAAGVALNAVAVTLTAASTRVEATITLADDATARQTIIILSIGVLASTASLQSALAANSLTTDVITAPATTLEMITISSRPAASPQSPALAVADITPSSATSLSNQDESSLPTGMSTTNVVIAVAAVAVLLALTLTIWYVYDRRQKKKMAVASVRAAHSEQINMRVEDDLHIHTTFSENFENDHHESQQEIELILSLQASRMKSIEAKAAQEELTAAAAQRVEHKAEHGVEHGVEHAIAETPIDGLIRTRPPAIPAITSCDDIIVGTAQTTITFPGESPLGIGLTNQEGGGVVMSSVEPSSPAAAVPVWTRLVAINGQDACGMSKAAVMSAIQAAKVQGDVTIAFGEPNPKSDGTVLL